MISVASFGDRRVAVLLEVEGVARLDIVDQHAIRLIASAKGQPTALATIGSRLAFATTDADGAATIRIGIDRVFPTSGRVYDRFT